MSFQKAHGLVPAPVSLTIHPSGDTYVLPATTRLTYAPELRDAARWWRRTTEGAFGLDVLASATPVPDGAASPAADVTFALDPAGTPGGYRLEITAAGVRVDAADLAGAHAAAQTLRQLAGPPAYRTAPVTTAGSRPTPATTRHTATGNVGSAGIPGSPGDAGNAGNATHDTAAEADAGPPAPATGPGLPCLQIVDHPRFGWRGVLLDVARHFLPKADVLRFVDLAAAHKLNVVQLHLTDDQGWRMQVERYPLLTEVGGWRTESNLGTWRAGVLDGRPHGGFYTQDDLREIVAFARDRGVTVVPEIDVPGHVEAAVAAYPELGTRKQPHSVRTTWGVSTEVLDPSEESLAFFRNVLDEVFDVFDSPWVALGGDEVPTVLWRDNPEIVARAAALGLPDVRDLHGWFLARLCEHVTAAGRHPVVWDEAFGEQLPRDAVVTSWRGFAVGARALAAGHDVVMSPEQVVYLDHRASDHPDEPVPVGFVRTVEDVYGFDPLPQAVLAELDGLDELDGDPARGQARDVAQGPARTDGPDDAAQGTLLGAQATVWSEHLDSVRRVDYTTYPRLSAFAEVVWSPAGDRAPGTPASREFLERLEHDHLPRLDAAGVEYRPLDGPRPWQTRPGVQGFARDLDAEMAAGGWAGVGGWVEGRDEEHGGPA